MCMCVFTSKNNKDFRDFSQSERSCFILSDELQRKREKNGRGREKTEKEKCSTVKKKTNKSVRHTIGEI